MSFFCFKARCVSSLPTRPGPASRAWQPRLLGICLQPPALLLQGGCYSPISRVPPGFSMSPDNSASPGSCGKLGVLLSHRLTGWAVGSWTGRGLRGIPLMGAGVTLPSVWARQRLLSETSQEWKELGGPAWLGRAYHLVHLSEPETGTRSRRTEYS